VDNKLQKGQTNQEELGQWLGVENSASSNTLASKTRLSAGGIDLRQNSFAISNMQSKSSEYLPAQRYKDQLVLVAKSDLDSAFAGKCVPNHKRFKKLILAATYRQTGSTTASIFSSLATIVNSP
jgi:hypothetical protein